MRLVNDFDKLYNVRTNMIRKGSNFFYNGEDGLKEYILEDYITQTGGYAKIICLTKNNIKKEIIIHENFDNYTYVDKLSNIKDKEY